LNIFRYNNFYAFILLTDKQTSCRQHDHAVQRQIKGDVSSDENNEERSEQGLQEEHLLIQSDTTDTQRQE